MQVPRRTLAVWWGLARSLIACHSLLVSGSGCSQNNIESGASSACWTLEHNEAPEKLDGGRVRTHHPRQTVRGDGSPWRQMQVHCTISSFSASEPASGMYCNDGQLKIPSQTPLPAEGRRSTCEDPRPRSPPACSIAEYDERDMFDRAKHSR